MTSPAPSDDGWVGEGFFFPFLFRPLYYTVAVGPFIIRYSFEPREVRRRRSLSLLAYRSGNVGSSSLLFPSLVTF